MIRFLAAVSVMICHSFSIAEGEIEGEWLYQLTSGQLNFGLLSVAILFLAAGFFSVRSAEYLQTAEAYFTARAKRIFPQLIFVNSTVMLLGVFFTKLSLSDYFLSPKMWLYSLNNVFIPVHNLPGVFEDNPFLPTVNGSLWTMSVIAACYVACFCMYKWGMTTRKGYLLTIPVACLALLVLNLEYGHFPSLENAVFTCFFFYAGMGCWIFRDRMVLSYRLAAISFLIIIGSCFCGQGRIGLLVGLPYLLFFISYGLNQVPIRIGDLGNYSYGMYLWGFPVQQAVQDCMGESGTPVKNLMVAVPLTIVLGIITSHIKAGHIVPVWKKEE